MNVYGAQESISPAYIAWRAGTTNRVVVPARQPENRFLGSSKGLQVRALVEKKIRIREKDSISNLGGQK